MMFIHTYQLNPFNPFTFIWLAFWNAVPDRGKRLFVITSLYVKLNEVDDADEEKLREVNQAFSLSRKNNALYLPALVSCWVWRRLLPFRKVKFHNEENVDHYVNRLVTRTPCWLWYADYEERRKDIQHLVNWLRPQHQP